MDRGEQRGAAATDRLLVETCFRFLYIATYIFSYYVLEFTRLLSEDTD